MFDIIKLIIETLTPVIVLIFGIKINKILKKQESAVWTNQKILEKRLALYDEVIPMLNDIYCFHCYVGNWKELSPADMVNHKRKLDKKMACYGPLFSDDLSRRYHNFMEECYSTFSGWGNDAKIKALYGKRREHSKEWDDAWADMFDDKTIKTHDDEKQSNERKSGKYNDLIESFRENLELFRPGGYRYGERPWGRTISSEQ